MTDYTNYLKKEANTALAKKLNIVAWVLTFVVLGLVGMMRRPEFKISTDIDFGFLPPFHATVNALMALVLIAALYFIKQKNIEAHKKAIYVAFGLSVLFLGSYVVYHFTNTETLYGDTNHDGLVDAAELVATGGMRSVYLVLLLTHIAAAAISFPFILFTFIRAYTNQFAKHRKMARWVFPVWLYVAITGPVCYWMLAPYYA